MAFHHSPDRSLQVLLKGQHGGAGVMAGGNKALLTLASGETLVLNDSTYGELAEQDGVEILGRDDGMLMYRACSGAGSDKGYNIITTPRGGQFSVVLTDGTKIWLNNASRLRFPVSFGRRKRRVELSGEAYFRVAAHKEDPFVIRVRKDSQSTRNIEVEVQDTEVDIKAYPDDTSWKTTAVGGSVKVRADGAQLDLAPGQQAGGDTGQPLHLTANGYPERVTAWKNGLFSFDGQPIRDIMQQAARWYDIEVIYKDSIEQRFYGRIPRQVDLATFLQMLEATGWVHFTLRDRTVTVEK